MAVISVVAFSELSEDQRLDSDFYQPKYLEQDSLLAHFPCEPLAPRFAEVSDGNHLTIAEQFCAQGVRYLRGQDLSDFFLSDSDPIFIPEDVFTTLTRSHMYPGDILLGIVGSIGSVSLVTSRHQTLTGNCKIAIIRPHAIPPEFLGIWLASRFGQNEIKRAVRGSVQMGVILPDVRKLPVPALPTTVIDRAVDLVKTAERYHRDSLNLYPEAEKELVDRLGWTKLVRPDRELYYIENHSNLAAADRCDPEHFQPQYRRLRQHLQHAGAQPLSDLWLSCDKGTQPNEYMHEGDVIVVKSRNVSGQGVNLEECERTSLLAWADVPARLTAGDVVFNSTGRGTLGRAAVIPKSTSRIVASVDLLICRVNGEKVLPEYLALFLNSPPGLAQSEQFQTGSSGQLHLYPQHLQRFLVYLPVAASGEIDLKWQQRLAAKVIAAREANAQAQAKLREATALVERAIDQPSTFAQT